MMEAIVLKSVAVAVGAFFGISGWHKLFNEARRETLRATSDGMGLPRWFGCGAVPAGELLGGVALVPGILVPFAAIGLLAICLGAFCLDGVKRIPGMEPLDKADWLDDALYLPEAGYILLLMVLAVTGWPAPYSVDALVLGVIG